MRGRGTIASILWACALLSAIATRAAAEPRNGPTSLPDEFLPLDEGGWVAGFAGAIGRTDDRVSPRNATDLDVRTQGFRYQVGSRSGYFLRKHFLVGLDLQLSVTNATSSTRTGREVFGITDYEERLFIGPWLRYYFPVSNAWALFPEFSWGFQNQYRSQDTGTGAPSEERSSGLSFNLGFGFTYFLTRNVAFDVTGRYSRGRLRGRIGGLPTKNDFSDVGLLIGFQVYLPEFAF